MTTSYPIGYNFSGERAAAQQNEGSKGEPLPLVDGSEPHKEPSDSGSQPAAQDVESSCTTVLVKQGFHPFIDSLPLASDPNKPYQIQVFRLEEKPAEQRPEHLCSSRHVVHEASSIPRAGKALLRRTGRLKLRDVDADPVKNSAKEERAIQKELSNHGIHARKKDVPKKNDVVDTSLSLLVNDSEKGASPVTLPLPFRRVPRASARQPNACWACCLKCLQWLCGRPNP